jgi:hypothetical protein
MTVKRAAPKAQKPRRVSRTAIQSAIPSIPLSVAAVERFVNRSYGDSGIDPEFMAAWAFLPKFVRAISNDENEHGGPNRFDFVQERVRAAARRRAIQDGPSRRGLANILEWIEEVDSDYLTTLQIAFMEPAFNLGLALGCALFANPASLAINGKDGAR